MQYLKSCIGEATERKHCGETGRGATGLEHFHVGDRIAILTRLQAQTHQECQLSIMSGSVMTLQHTSMLHFVHRVS